MRSFLVIDTPWVMMGRSPHQHGTDDLIRPCIVLKTLVRKFFVPVLLQRDLGLRCELLGLFYPNQSLTNISCSLDHHGHTNIIVVTHCTANIAPSPLIILLVVHFIVIRETATCTSVYVMNLGANLTCEGESGSVQTCIPSLRTLASCQDCRRTTDYNAETAWMLVGSCRFLCGPQVGLSMAIQNGPQPKW